MYPTFQIQPSESSAGDEMVGIPRKSAVRPHRSLRQFSHHLDSGDDTVLEPGMIFSVEPGLCVPALGDFRHSDTVVITDSGIEVLNYYPRDLPSLTIPIMLAKAAP